MPLYTDTLQFGKLLSFVYSLSHIFLKKIFRQTLCQMRYALSPFLGEPQENFADHSEGATAAGHFTFHTYQIVVYFLTHLVGVMHHLACKHSVGATNFWSRCVFFSCSFILNGIFNV